MRSAEAIEAGAGSVLGSFVEALASDGRVTVGLGPLRSIADSALKSLAVLDAEARAELGPEPPVLDAPAGVWGATLLYRLCQFLVGRHLGPDLIAEACAVPCPSPRCPATDWSVDLSLRQLPALHRMAAGFGMGDPLVDHLRRLARAWPLSSVGIPGLEGPMDLGSFIGHRALARLYADRVLHTGDRERLGDARVDDILRADLGGHPELAPGIASMLFPTPQPDCPG